MTEAVAPVKPRSNRVALASMLVFVLGVAFAAAFYLLGGMGLVGRLGDFLPTASSAPPVARSAAPSEATPTPGPSGVLQLPAGVAEDFARRMYAEQLESQVNIGKLVTGKVGSFVFGEVRRSGSEARIDMSVVFRDGTSAPGTMVLADRGRRWYLESVSGRRADKTDGDADSVSTGVDEDAPAHVRESARIDVDVDVLNTMLEQHAAHQDLLSEIVSGGLDALVVESVEPGAGTATMRVTVKGAKRPSTKGRILCISKSIDGRETWFVVSFEEV